MRHGFAMAVIAFGLLSVSCGSETTKTALEFAPDIVDVAVEDVPASLELLETDLQPELRRPPDIDELLEDGRYWLINAEPAFALAAFEAALEIAPNNQDAIFGAGLSEYVRAAEFFAMILTLPTQFGAYGAGDGTSPAPEPQSQNDYLAEELHQILLFLREGFVAAEGHFQRLDDPSFTWTIEQVPVYVFTKPVVNFKGTFDRADIYLLQGSNAFFLWFTELLAAQDFHTDLLTAVYGALTARDEGVDLLSILDILATLIASDERFFQLHETDGEALFEAGQRHMREVGEFLLLGLLEQSEGEEGAEQAFSVVYEVNGPVLYINERVDFLTGEPELLAIKFDQELLDLTADFLERMETPGEYVPFSHSGALQLGTALGFATKLDLLRFMPVEIPIDLSNLEPAQVVSLLTLFLGDSIALDYGTFFQNPAGLRTFLPRLLKVPDPAGPEDYLMEWECPGDISEAGTPTGAGKFLCNGEAELVDSGHFADTSFSIDADGLASPLPYMVWDDPTWAGLLAVDEFYVENGGDPANYISPDLYWTNLGIRLWIESLLGLL
jgi:hypothetical protein